MKFTSEDLMKAMGLKVGDRVVCLDSRYIFEVIKHENNVYLMCRNTNIETQFIHYLLNVEFEILPQPKRVGDRICDQFCDGCPLVVLQCFSEEEEKKSLFLVLDETLNRHTDQEIYDILKDRLDKEVE